MIEEFERHLRGTNLSENTVTSYLFAVRQFGERHDAVTKCNLKEHKAWLIEQYKPRRSICESALSTATSKASERIHGNCHPSRCSRKPSSKMSLAKQTTSTSKTA